MSDTPHDEQAAQQAETDRLDDLAKQNEDVRRAEHPEEFADDGTDDGGDQGRHATPVAPAGTGATDHEPDPAELERLAELEQAAADPSPRPHVREALKQAADELRRKLFGGPTL